MKSHVSAFLVVALLALAPTAVAVSGEGEAAVVEIAPAAKRAFVPNPGANKDAIARAALQAEMVAVVKVIEIVEPDKKDEEKKDAEDEDGEAPAQQQAVGVVFGMRGINNNLPTIRKEFTAEVVEMIKGGKGTKQVKIAADIFKRGSSELLVIEIKTPNFTSRNMLPLNLPKDKESLVFLKPAKDSAGEGDKRTWELMQPLPAGAPKESVAAAAEAIRKAAEWDKDPELSPEDTAAIDALITDLGDKDFAKREKATETLIAMGEAVRGKVRQARKSDDPEVRERADHILEIITPSYLKTNAAGTDASSPFGSNGVMIMRQQVGGGVGQVQIQMQAGGVQVEAGNDE